MNDLIYRLHLVKNIFDGHAEGDLHPYLEQSDAIGEAITLLSAPTSEEVQAECRHLRLEHEKRAADLIERLNRAYGGVRNDMKQASKIISEQEQRIEELSTPLPDDVVELCRLLRLGYMWAIGAEVDLNEQRVLAADLIERLAQERGLWKATSDGFSVALRQAEQQRDAFEESAKQELFEDGFDDSGIDPKSYMQGRLDFIEEVRDRIRAMGGE